MRIFSIHKSKSKIKISDKTPKLAAKKFLEKKKVGTIIYLHEHPSGKIHGPYQKDYDKKIMKGGLSDSDFKVPRDKNVLLLGTSEFLINRPRNLITREPHIYFGDATKNEITGEWYYRYLLINKKEGMNITQELKLFERSFDSITRSIVIKEILLTEMTNMGPKLLLALYYQYILRCQQDYPDSSTINYGRFGKLYMRRLFLFLMIYVLPIITDYIINKYFKKDTGVNIRIDKTNVEMDNIVQMYFTSIKNIGQKLVENNDYYTRYTNPDDPIPLTPELDYLELQYFMVISCYIKNIDINELVTEIAKMYGIFSSDKTKQMIDNAKRDAAEKIRLKNEKFLSVSALIFSKKNKNKISYQHRNVLHKHLMNHQQKYIGKQGIINTSYKPITFSKTANAIILPVATAIAIPFLIISVLLELGTMFVKPGHEFGDSWQTS